VLKFFHFPKKDINFCKIFSGEKIFIKSPYHKKKHTHPLSPSTPSHITKIIIPWKFLKIPLSYLEKQPKFSFPCHPRNKVLD